MTYADIESEPAISLRRAARPLPPRSESHPSRSQSYEPYFKSLWRHRFLSPLSPKSSQPLRPTRWTSKRCCETRLMFCTLPALLRSPLLNDVGSGSFSRDCASGRCPPAPPLRVAARRFRRLPPGFRGRPKEPPHLGRVLALDRDSHRGRENTTFRRSHKLYEQWTARRWAVHDHQRISPFFRR